MRTTSGTRGTSTRTGIAAAGGAVATAALALSLCLVGVAAIGSPAAADTVPGTPPTSGTVTTPVTTPPVTTPPVTTPPVTTPPVTTPPVTTPPVTTPPVTTPPATTTPKPTPSPTKPTPTPTKPKPTPTPTPTKPAPKPPVVQNTLRLPMSYGARGPYVALLQQRLQWLGYGIHPTELKQRWFGASTRTAVSRFQAKFFLNRTGSASKGTWSTIASKAGRIGSIPSSCRSASLVLCIDKNAKLLRYVRNGHVDLTLDARFGMESTPTRTGTFRIYRKARDHVSSLYHTWMPYAMFFSGGQAVHYSPYFARDGYSGASHGCVNIRDMARVRWIFDHAPLGTRVYVYRS